MSTWLTPNIAVLLMYSGVIPSLLNVYLLYDDRNKPGVLWFLVSMATGGAWAFLYATLTLVQSPAATLFLANFFWAAVPTAAVSLFLLAYEFVFKEAVSRRLALVLFSPVAALFLLSWFNPFDLVFTPAYHLTPAGYLASPALDGIVKELVTKVYGYLLVLLAAGMFMGEAMRTSGIRRRQTIYLLVPFSVLATSAIIKVTDFVPVYFDPTSMLYSFSGLLFAYSINRDGLLKFAAVAREQTFDEVNDAIVVVNADGVVVDVNQFGRRLFGPGVVGTSVEDVLADHPVAGEDDATRTVRIDVDGERRQFSLRESSISYGRDLSGTILVLSDVSTVKEREAELNLLKQILSRIFRHNVRSDLSVIIGYTEMIGEQADDDVAGMTETILEHATHLVEQSEKARELEDVVSRDEMVTRSLRETVAEAISASQQGDETAAVSSAVDDVFVDVHPKFGLAVRELIENAMTHARDGDGTSVPEIDVSTEANGDRVDLVVEDDGSGIPQSEIDVLRAKRETSLQHGSGVGLWLVRWIVARSNGDLTVESAANGTRIGISLTAVDSPGEPTD